MQQIAPVNCCGVAHKYICSQFFFRSFSYQFRSIFVFQHFSEFLSAISQKFKQESKEIYFLYGENIIFIQVFFFSICCIVPLFYTEKGNYFSLTRFALRFSDFFLIYFCIMHTCNHVLYVCVLVSVCFLLYTTGKKVFSLQMMMCYH